MHVCRETKHITWKVICPRLLQNQLMLLCPPAHVHFFRNDHSSACYVPGRCQERGRRGGAEASPLHPWLLRRPGCPTNPPAVAFSLLGRPSPSLGPRGQSQPAPTFSWGALVPPGWPARGRRYTNLLTAVSSPLPGMGSPGFPAAQMDKRGAVQSEEGALTPCYSAALPSADI